MTAGAALAGLDRVAWSELQHAWGPAGDVPRQLRALASDDAGTREAALDALSTSLWHQGRLFPATAAAIPFLLELVDGPGTPDRPMLMLFLADAGRSAAFGDDPWYGGSLAALAAGVPILERRLASDDEVERIAAMVALAWADDGRVLRGRLQTGDEGERLVALYALAAGRVVPDPAVLAPLAEAGPQTTRLAARLGVVRAGGPWAGQIDVEAYGALAEVVGTIAPMALPQPVELLDPASATPEVVRTLATALRRARHHRIALPLIEFLLPAALPDGYDEPPTELQLDVLRAVADSPGAWTYPANTAAALAEQGLDVADRIDLCVRVGIDGPDGGAGGWDRDDTEALLAASELCGVRFEDLDDHHRAMLERFVDELDGLGWNDTRNWHNFVTSGSGFAISPIGVGRHFNEKAVLECTLWLFDEHVAADTGERTGSPYARLLVTDKAERRDPLGFRAYADDAAALAAVLAVIDRHRPSLDREGRADAFLHELFGVTSKVEVELADGRVLEIRPRADPAGDPA
jgi:hypothetical protein